MYNFKEQVYQAMTRLRSSRAPSIPDARVTDLTDGLLVSKPTKKEPEIIDLQEYVRSGNAAATVQSINKTKVISA